jgi:branched-chain amino acid aminotransferase
MTGTAAQITAVTKVDYRTIGSGKIGPVTSRLRTVFSDVLHGRSPKYCLWNTPVYG